MLADRRLEKPIAVALIALCVVTTFPALALSRPTLAVQAKTWSFAGPTRYVPFVIAVLFIIDALYVRQFLKTIALGIRGDLVKLGLISIATLIALTSVVLLRWYSAINALALMILLTNLTVFHRSSPSIRNTFFRTASVFIYTYIGLAFLVYGMPQHRWVGGIHPNLLAGSALAGAALAGLGFRRIWIAFWMLSLVVAVMVDSRYAVVALLASASVFFLLRSRRTDPLRITAFAAILLLAIVVAASQSQWIADVFALDEPTRGLRSGMSGRSALNARFLDQFSNHFIFGFGFRARDVYLGHNGYLNALLENGLYLGGALISLAFVALARAVWSAVRLSTHESQIVASFLAAIALSTYFQPQFINFGDAMGFTFLLLITAVPPSNAAVLERGQLPRVGYARRVIRL